MWDKVAPQYSVLTSHLQIELEVGTWSWTKSFTNRKRSLCSRGEVLWRVRVYWKVEGSFKTCNGRATKALKEPDFSICKIWLSSGKTDPSSDACCAGRKRWGGGERVISSSMNLQSSALLLNTIWACWLKRQCVTTPVPFRALYMALVKKLLIDCIIWPRERTSFRENHDVWAPRITATACTVAFFFKLVSCCFNKFHTLNIIWINKTLIYKLLIVNSFANIWSTSAILKINRIASWETEFRLKNTLSYQDGRHALV